MFKYLTLIALSFFMSYTMAADCSPQGVDVCKIATEAASEMAANLPQVVNRNMTITQAFAVGNILGISVVMHTTREDLINKVKVAGITMKDLGDKLRHAAQQNMCNGEVTGAFIRLGGILQYTYKFSDATVYLTIPISECQ